MTPFSNSLLCEKSNSMDDFLNEQGTCPPPSPVDHHPWPWLTEYSASHRPWLQSSKVPRSDMQVQRPFTCLWIAILGERVLKEGSPPLFKVFEVLWYLHANYGTSNYLGIWYKWTSWPEVSFLFGFQCSSFTGQEPFRLSVHLRNFPNKLGHGKYVTKTHS